MEAEKACCIGIVIKFVSKYILIIMNIIIINIKAIGIIVDTVTDNCGTADSAVSEIENRHHL